MAKQMKSLKVSDIKSVDENGNVAPDAFAAIAAEERMNVTPKTDRKPLVTIALDAGLVGQIIANKYTPFPNYGTSFTFGVLKGAVKWHVYEHFAIMGVLNGIASCRLGHYALVEEGLHLKHTFEEVARKHLYEGTFGYVKFETMSEAWLKVFEAHKIVPNAEHQGEWLKLVIKNQRVTYGHWISPVSLEETAQKLGKDKIGDLSPITIKNNEETWNTWHKRNGVEAALRIARGELHVVAAVNLVKGKALKGNEWVIKVENARFDKLYGPASDLAKAMGDAAGSAEAQLAADQEGFVTKDVPADVVEQKAQSVGKLVCYGGDEYTPHQLVRAGVRQMLGDLEKDYLYLRDLPMVLKQFDVAASKGMTLKVVKLAA